MTWKNESRRHSLASRGVKTAVNNKSVVVNKVPLNNRTLLGDIKKGRVEEVEFVSSNPVKPAVINYDLTDFNSVKDFKLLLTKHNLKSRVVKKRKLGFHEYSYEWYNDDVVMTTSNNVITGEYKVPSEREAEKITNMEQILDYEK